jgi:hypothetical protein
MKSHFFILLGIVLGHWANLQSQTCIYYPLSGPNKLCTTTASFYTVNGVTVGLGLQSSNTNILTVGNTFANAGLVTAINPGTAILSYRYRMNCGMDTVLTLSVTVGNYPPVLDSIQGTNKVNVGASITFTNSSVGGTWSCTPLNRANISNTGVLTGLSTGLVSVFYQVINPCGTTTTKKNINVICIPDTTTTSVTACDSYLWPRTGGVFFNSGTYYASKTDSMTGCMHVDRLVLTINRSSTDTTYITACNSYFWAITGGVFTTSGIYRAISTNPAGCSQTSILNLTITNTSGALISGNSTICVGMSSTYTSNGLPGGVWASSNTAIARFTSPGVLLGVSSGAVNISYTIPGCAALTKRVVVDSIKPTIKCPGNITVNAGRTGCSALISVPNPTYSDNCSVTTLKYSVTFNGVTANSPGTGINLVGTKTFSVGTYTIGYTALDGGGLSAGCKFTVTVKSNSLCPAVTSEPVLETRSADPDFTLAIAPNPFRHEIKLELNSNSDKPTVITVYNTTGQRILMIQGHGSSTYLMGSEWPSGIYIAQVQQGDQVERIKMIKQE